MTTVPKAYLTTITEEPYMRKAFINLIRRLFILTKIRQKKKPTKICRFLTF